MKISMPKPYSYHLCVSESMNERLTKLSDKLNIPVTECIRIILDSALWSMEFNANNKNNI